LRPDGEDPPLGTSGFGAVNEASRPAKLFSFTGGTGSSVGFMERRIALSYSRREGIPICLTTEIPLQEVRLGLPEIVFRTWPAATTFNS
jgi:hypothetical protein